MMKARYGTMVKGNVNEGLKKSKIDQAKLDKFKIIATKKISGSAVSKSEANKLEAMMPKITDSGSVREAKKNAIEKKISKLSVGGEPKSTKGYGAARTSGMGLQDQSLKSGQNYEITKGGDYIKDLI